MKKKRISKPLKWILYASGFVWACLFTPGCSSPVSAMPVVAQPEPTAEQVLAADLMANRHPAPEVNVGVFPKHYPPCVTRTILLEAYANSLEQQAKALELDGLPGAAETQQAARSMKAAYQRNLDRFTPEERALYDGYQHHSH